MRLTISNRYRYFLIVYDSVLRSLYVASFFQNRKSTEGARASCLLYGLCYGRTPNRRHSSYCRQIFWGGKTNYLIIFLSEIQHFTKNAPIEIDSFPILISSFQYQIGRAGCDSRRKSSFLIELFWGPLLLQFTDGTARCTKVTEFHYSAPCRP